MIGSRREPLVSIGLPVFNGATYLEEALESLLGQTHRKLEIIISDNASSDETSEICRRVVARDARVVYHRQARNLGAAPNFNWVFRQAQGEYFKWAAHDDVCAPEFVQRCVRALEMHPEHILAYPLHDIIDQRGDHLDASDGCRDYGAGDPGVRLRAVLRQSWPDGPAPWPIFGVVRRSALADTRLHGSYTGSDRTLLAELALRGPFYEIGDRLFQNRDHAGRSIRISDRADSAAHPREAWFDTAREGKIVFPNWLRLRELVTGVGQAPLELSDKLRCGWVVLNWGLVLKYKPLVRDVALALSEVGKRIFAYLSGTKARSQGSPTSTRQPYTRHNTRG